ncbi:MAG: AsnC family transcriptional regulator [bacterium]|nr:MAG: AsnC family transcriptional regulator [bacterium]KAF0148995.1 MAG: AsnC family transcriptional regulator [bacterium]KAF0165989.1 MAG: AsnC family transcriptional regulator [bacterium]TXT17524.1 MAG: AsnC family transcriptional regulator [bacterium]
MSTPHSRPTAATHKLDDVDRRLVRASQGGLPLVPRPYHQLADQLGLPPEEVIGRLRAMLDSGVIRRIGVVPNHYALGYVANGMTVWDVDDARIDALGEAVGRLDCVSHCYRRPRRPPMWPYNLFAMVHGHSREEVETQAEHIAALLGPALRARDILYSSHILKKTGLRLTEPASGER